MCTRFVALALGVLVAGTWPSSVALAQSDVLLPSDNGGSPPNLGLTPGTPSSSSGQSIAPAAPTPAQNYTPVPETTTTSTPLPSAPLPTTPEQAQAYYNPVMKTQVIKLPGTPSNMFTGQGDQPNSLEISVDNKLTPGDVARVGKQLGIPAKNVPTQCSLSVSGLIQTDKGPGTFDSGQDIKTTIQYGGRLTSVMATTRVLCSISGDLPPNKGTIFQMGDKYVVQIGGAGCQAPANVTPASVVITNGEYGSGQCQFH